MNKRNYFILSFTFVFLLLFLSCDLLRDSPYEVEAWTPGEYFNTEPEKIKVSLLFSHESDKVKTEQAFSFSEDNETLKGYFSWEGLRLVFTPASPLESGHDYFISLGTGAQDSDGLSLENKFEVSFSTRPQGGKPKITGTAPEYEGIISESRGEFRLFFSEAVDLDSCRDAVSFNPSAVGSWRLENENKTACFTPRDPWEAGNLYRIKVESSFSAASGRKLGTDYLTHFSAGEDKEKPALIKVFALNYEKDYEEIHFEKNSVLNLTEYKTWENETRLCFIFSEPVDLSNIKNLLSAEPNISIVMESPPEMSNRAVFRFAEHEQEKYFILRLGRGIKDSAGNESGDEYYFRIKTSGPYSKPPALAGIRLPMSPGKNEDQKVLSFSCDDIFAALPIECGENQYPLKREIPTWIEFYFECAPDTEIDPFSVMDLFRVESTNQALTFSPESITNKNFSMDSPREGWERFCRMEVRGVLINTVNSGIVTFRIPPGLRDKRGNRSAEDFRISLLK